MSSILDAVNQRTRLVGHNRLELLLFRLNGPQPFGINVFKVREVLRCPPLTVLPNSHHCIRGVANVRGLTMPIFDLGLSTGFGQLPESDRCFVIITEYNTSTQGFLVQSVDRIVNVRWEAMRAPPAGADHYLTAVSEIDGALVEVLDVEKVLQEIIPREESVSEALIEQARELALGGQRILVADDSAVARKQIVRCAESLGVEVVQQTNGRAALDHLLDLAEAGVDVADHYALLVSDIEMPEMDGYTLTAEIRRDSRLAKLHILLHTSLSGVFNRAMVQRVGADDFLPKFSPDELAERLVEHLHNALLRRATRAERAQAGA
jgi:two-component system chemotaxis response regulator CheV